ncbi:beta-ketoacyl synthase N-terminal-like domain-containing protein [Dactylosporangium sp. CS-033363]|uniref:beta-ketoacyl synthase N-terminal-like domain-containing protein n=1 Tax=Dactylosporangium sp. CS-033363 TaxID=3239935 RepID=UPI003D8E4766
MSPLSITGFSAITSAEPVDVRELYAEPLPASHAHARTTFVAREHLGRKGTSSYDRATGLAVVCCQDAVRAAGLQLDATTGRRTGVALGTSLGSFKSTSDYTMETLVQERPYLVNPLLFPNTVMNGAAGQVGIRLGLRGINATIAGGTLGFLNALRYAANAIRRGYADAMLAGAVEEFTPHRAWASHLTGATRAVSSGEAAAVFTLTVADPPPWTGPRRLATVLAVATGFGPGGSDAGDLALAGCVRRVLHGAKLDPVAVAAVHTGEAEAGERQEYGPVVAALGGDVPRMLPKRRFGECDAASGAVALAAVLAAPPDGLDAARRGPEGGDVHLFTARGADGAVGAALIEVYR